MSPDTFDVIIVGARCAGSPLATLLARANLKVCLLDRAEFPSDTLSTHVFEAGAISFLSRLGVLDRVLATGAPPLHRARSFVDDADLSVDFEPEPGVGATSLCVRRTALDEILVNAAAASGVELRTGTRVTNLVHENGRVVGVQTESSAGLSQTLRARLVVGADGRHSDVARLASAEAYNVTKNGRMYYWRYFEGTRHPANTVLFHRWSEELVMGAPADGCFMAAVAPPVERAEAFRKNPEAEYAAIVRQSHALSEILEGAKPVGKLRGIVSFDCFFRQASGRGWMLIGDAGHFKDPATAQGIADAFKQAEESASFIQLALSKGASGQDAALRKFGSWRDRFFSEKYWFSHDLSRGGKVPPLVLELLRGLSETTEGRQAFWNVFQQRLNPSQVLTPRRLGAATFRLFNKKTEPHPFLDAGAVVAEDVRRKLLVQWPQRGSSALSDEAV